MITYDVRYTVKRLSIIHYFTQDLRLKATVMKSLPLDFVSEAFFPVSAPWTASTKPGASLGERYFLIVDGFRIGPFLCTGPIDHLEALLHARGIRMPYKLLRQEET
jgi:hypothetical protein